MNSVCISLIAFFCTSFIFSGDLGNVIVKDLGDNTTEVILVRKPSQIDIYFKDKDSYLLRQISESTPKEKISFDTIEKVDQGLYDSINDAKTTITNWRKDSTMKQANKNQQEDKDLRSTLKPLFANLLQINVTYSWKVLPRNNGVLKTHNEYKTFIYPAKTTVQELRNVIYNQLNTQGNFYQIEVLRENIVLPGSEILPNINNLPGENTNPQYSLQLSKSKLIYTLASSDVTFTFKNPPIYLQNKPIDELELKIDSQNKIIGSYTPDLEPDRKKNVDIPSNDTNFLVILDLLRKQQPITLDNIANETNQKMYSYFKKAAQLWADKMGYTISFAPEPKPTITPVFSPRPAPEVSPTAQSFYQKWLTWNSWKPWLQAKKNTIAGVLSIGTIGALLMYRTKPSWFSWGMPKGGVVPGTSTQQ